MKKGLTPQNKKRAEYALFLEQLICCYWELYTNTAAESRVLIPGLLACEFVTFSSEGVKKSNDRMSPQPLPPTLSRRERAIERRNLHVYLPLNEEDAPDKSH
jgi:hypothetical protein